MDRIHLECTEGNHYKFWEAAIEVEMSGKARLVTRWGRIGSAGQTREYTFNLVTAARSRRDSIVREKLAKGYREISRRDEPTPPPAGATPDGSRQAALLLVELAIANRSSPSLIGELLKDVYRLVPELDGEEDLDSLREGLLAPSVPIGF
jgi:predicted DNA-binding WGR domain protein